MATTTQEQHKMLGEISTTISPEPAHHTDFAWRVSRDSVPAARPQLVVKTPRREPASGYRKRLRARVRSYFIRAFFRLRLLLP